MKLCIKFQEGRCQKSEAECKNGKHSTLKDATVPPTAYSPKASPRGRGGKPSKKAIEQAKKAHAQGKGVMPPCKYYLAGNCTNGKSCPWPHSDKKAKPSKHKAKAYFGIAVGAGTTGDDMYSVA